MHQAAALPKPTAQLICRTILLGLASVFFVIAALRAAFGELEMTGQNLSSVFYGAPVYASLATLFAACSLLFSKARPSGHLLSGVTFATSCLLMTGSVFWALIHPDPAPAHHLSLGAALMMVLRAFAVWALPPRGERVGFREALISVQLGILCGGFWLAIAPENAVIAGSVSLLLSWPYLVDGINAFADKVYHQAAAAAGARNLSPDAFCRVADARDIVIDKAAIMSGPNLIVTNVMAFNNEPRTLLAVAASAEAGSDHPAGIALKTLAGQWGVALKTPDRFEPAPGLGVEALLGGQNVVIGTSDLMKSRKIDSFTADAIARSLEADGKTVLRVAVGGRVVGVLGLEGTMRQDAGVAGMALRSEGLVPWLYSGDSEKTRHALAEMIGLETVADPQPGETVAEATRRTLSDQNPLILSLSKDRTSLELKSLTRAGEDGVTPEPRLIAVSNTEDIGAFPALKELSMRRTALAAHAARFLSGLSILCGVCGGLLLLPLSAAPVLFALNLAILLAFARFSIADRVRVLNKTVLIPANSTH